MKKVITHTIETLQSLQHSIEANFPDLSQDEESIQYAWIRAVKEQLDELYPLERKLSNFD